MCLCQVRHDKLEHSFVFGGDIPFCCGQGLYVDLVQNISRLIEPSLQLLRLRSLVSDGQRFFTLTPDITRFILKQHERMQINSTTPSMLCA